MSFYMHTIVEKILDYFGHGSLRQLGIPINHSRQSCMACKNCYLKIIDQKKKKQIKTNIPQRFFFFLIKKIKVNFVTFEVLRRMELTERKAKRRWSLNSIVVVVVRSTEKSKGICERK